MTKLKESLLCLLCVFSISLISSFSANAQGAPTSTCDDPIEVSSTICGNDTNPNTPSGLWGPIPASGVETLLFGFPGGAFIEIDFNCLEDDMDAVGDLEIRLASSAFVSGANPCSIYLQNVYDVRDSDGNESPALLTILVEFTGCSNDTEAPEVTCAEFTATFDACPTGFGPNTPDGNWIPIPASGMINNAVGGIFTSILDVSTCITDDNSALGDMEYTLVDSYSENSVPGCSIDLINEFGVRDECGNVAAATFIFRGTIQFDGPAPVITCPANVGVECGESLDPMDTGMATATSGCGTPVLTFEDNEAPACGSTAVITRTWTATDACGQTSTCEQIITTFDTEPPVAPMAPMATTVECDAIPMPEALMAMDACEGMIMGVAADMITDGACANAYTITRTWTFTDECGNSSDVSQMITVEDTTPPEVTCAEFQMTFSRCPDPIGPNSPSGNWITVPASGTFLTAVGGSSIATIDLNGCVTDNCGDFASMGLEYMISDSYEENRVPGCSVDIINEFMFRDECGNVSPVKVNFRGTIQFDGPAPVITCPANTTVECGASTDPMDTGMATATSDCGTPAITSEDAVAAGTCGNESVITRTWTATDGCGRTSTCEQIITIVDTTPPVPPAAPAPVTVECDAVPMPEVLVAMDACEGMITGVAADMITDGACANAYTITRTWTFTDDCGNASDVSQTITVEDTTPPDVTCAEFTMTFSTCPDFIFPNTPSGNWIAVPASGTFLTAVGGSFIQTVDLNGCVTDNCSDFADMEWELVSSYEENRVPGCSVDIINEIGIRDGCENESLTTIIVRSTLQFDGPAPVITCPANTTLECGASTDPMDTGMATATSDCGNPAITSSDVFVVDCGNAGVLTRTWTATDGCGRESTCEQIITIVDTTPPTVTVPADMTLECGEDTSPAATGMATALDVCEGDLPATSSDVSDVTQCDGGTILRTWTSTDDCGNAASELQTITVNPPGAPVVTCPADQVVSCFEDIVADPANLTVVTECGLGFTAYVKQPLITGGIPGCDGTTYTFIYKAVDDCGRVGQCEQQFLIQNDAPTVTVPAGGTVMCFDEIEVSVNDVTITGACDGPNVINVLPVTINGPKDCPGTTYTFTYRVKDFCNRIVEVDRVFTVGNNGAPTIVAPVDYSTECQASVNPDNAVVTTSCGNGVGYEVVVTGPQVFGTQGCSGAILRYTYTVTDACGRTASDVQDITLDNEAPVIACPETLQIFNCEDGNNNDLITAWIASVTATASCGGNVTLNNNYNGNAGMCINNGFTNVTFTAVDQCGRVSTCVGTIIIIDTEAPVIYQEPQEVLVPCNGVTQDIFDNWLATQGGAEAIDGCWGNNISWSTNPPNPQLNCAGGPQAIVVEFIARDGCGNTSSVTGIFNTKVQPTTVNISGQVSREDAEPVASVEMRISGGSAGIPDMDYTENGGDYGFPELEYEDNLVLSPEKNNDPLNGVSTYDLILMKKHILLTETLDSPYKRIAADVNRNGSISTFDLLLLRRLILHIDTEFTSNTSWRFVEADFVFPNADNPFETAFPETFNLSGSEEEQADFIGVKIGDLDLNAIANEFAGDTDDRSGLKDLTFEVADQNLRAGEKYQIDFTAQNFEQINGFQFTLNVDPTAVEFLTIGDADLSRFSDANYGLSKADHGAIPVSWNHDDFQNLSKDEVAFSLILTAKVDVQLSEVLSITSEYTRAEAYQSGELMNVNLAFDNETIVSQERFRLFQNQPNPFMDNTMIGFNLPEAGAVSLKVYDVSGRILYTQEGDFAKGYNQVSLDRANFPSGILYYRLSAGMYSDSKKMILLE